MIPRYVLDSDVLIWHLRGEPNVVEHVTGLAGKGVLLVSAIARAEVPTCTRPREEEATLRLLDNLETAPVTASIADRAAEATRALRRRGITVHLPDALNGFDVVFDDGGVGDRLGIGHNHAGGFDAPEPDGFESQKSVIDRTQPVGGNQEDGKAQVAGEVGDFIVIG